MSRPIRVIDSRNKQYFMVDDVYLNGYAKHLGVSASMIYISLCRHADKAQVAFPSQRLIAEELGLKERTVMEKIQVLKDWGIIDVERTKNPKGEWLNNTYILLDKSVWKSKPPTEKQQVESTYTFSANPPTEKQQYKDTHKKDTHIVTKVTSETEYGNGDVNEVLNYLKTKLEIPTLDGSEKVNRQYAWNLIKASKTGVAGVKWLIDQAAADGWWRNHITSMRDLWNNKVKLVSSKRSGVKVYAVED